MLPCSAEEESESFGCFLFAVGPGRLLLLSGSGNDTRSLSGCLGSDQEEQGEPDPRMGLNTPRPTPPPVVRIKRARGEMQRRKRRARSRRLGLLMPPLSIYP